MKKEKKPFRPIEKIKNFVKKIGTLNLILILVGVFFVWFNWKMIILFKAYGTIPETYACAVVGALLGEAGLCGMIRTNKDKRLDRKWQKEDESELKEEQRKEAQKLKESEDSDNG